MGTRVWRRCREAIIWTFVLLIGLSACNRTQIVPYRQEGPSDTGSMLQGRVIELEVDRRYFADRPNCVSLLPMVGFVRSERLGKLMEKYLALHLRLRFDRVIYGSERSGLLSFARFNPEKVKDRLRSRETAHCGYEFDFRLIQARTEFALVWAQLSLGLEARLTRARDGLVLWKARHTARRSEGGLAVSPLGAIASAAEASALVSDGDQVVSLVADLTRRVVAALPSRNQGYRSYCGDKPASFAQICNRRTMERHEEFRAASEMASPRDIKIKEVRSIARR
jgi:hypothetical protein